MQPPKTKATIQCQRCGIDCEKRSPGQKFCVSCKVVAEREANTERAKKRRAGLASRKGGVIQCKRCSTEMVSRGGRHWYCDPCRRDVKNETNKGLERQKRREAGALAHGDHRDCALCGSAFSITNAQQVFCEPCGGERKRELDLGRKRKYRREGGYRKWHSSRKASDPKYALDLRMKNAIRRGLRLGKGGQSWKDLVGFSLHELKLHIERQFLPGMTWENMDRWHIDHILPLASFEFSEPSDPGFKAAWALTNLRPLWAEDNISKKDKRLVLI